MYGGVRQPLGEVLTAGSRGSCESQRGACGTTAARPRPEGGVYQPSKEIDGEEDRRYGSIGRAPIYIAREFAGQVPELRGAALLGVSGTESRRVGRDERMIRDYIEQQEREDRRLDQLPLD